MKKTIGYIIQNNQREILLMLRDDEKIIPYPNTWYIPGGVVEDGEIVEEALFREVKEELNLKAESCSLIRIYDWEEKQEYIYRVKLELEPGKVTLGEGQKIRFFSEKEILNMELAFHDNQIAKDFFSNIASTKYILVGGYPHKASDCGKGFSEELISGFKETVKILDCLFARPEESWETAFAQDRGFFTRNLPNTRFELISANPVNFIEQLRRSDAIYIRGGDNQLLMKVLAQTGDWVSELKGKTLAGSSAGADLVAKYHYDLDNLELGSGLGLIPVKTLVHYGSDYNAPNVDWNKAEKLLKEYKEDLEIIKLPEGSFKIIEEFCP